MKRSPGIRRSRGRTAAEILANVLKSEPDWDRLPAQLPGGVRKILERCLKDRSRRLRDIGEAWVILDETKDEGESRTADILSACLTASQVRNSYQSPHGDRRLESSSSARR